jgi:hypothetical protein
MGIDVVAPGDPVRLPGNAEWELSEAPFQVTVSSDHLNAISLDDPGEGLYPLMVTEGDVAIWICAPDPNDSELPAEWPYADLASDTSGLVIDSGAPSGDSWLSTADGVVNLTDLGADGSWVIRAVSGYEEEIPLGLTAIEPAETTLGVAADVTLTGAGFDEGTTATIGGLPLSAPVLVEEGELTGRSPSGLPVGVHDVMVTGEDGETATLIGAFTVSEPEDTAPPDTGIDDTAPPEDTSPDDTAPEDSAIDDTGVPVEDGPGCGCDAGAAGGGWWLVLAVAGVWRRPLRG